MLVQYLTTYDYSHPSSSSRSLSTKPITCISHCLLIQLSLLKIRILMRIHRCTAAEKLNICDRLYLMPCSGRNQNGIAGPDFPFITIDFHPSLTLQHKIDFLTELMIMPLSLPTCRQSGFGKTLFFHRCVRAVENTPDRRAIGCGKWFLFAQLADRHAAYSRTSW